MAEITGLFPIPLMQIRKLVPREQALALADRAIATADTKNAHSEQLSHTEIVSPADDPELSALEGRVLPHLREFGEHLFGETLAWTVKEMWTNVLRRGGSQAVHSHANSFVSGILYLTSSHASSRTVFHKGLGGTEFVFSNFNRDARIGPYNGTKWVMPAPQPGDLVLYPSYLLHEVPRNEGEVRVTLAMNAIPDRLDSWGYRIRFAPES
jgi:uncharacterized protein (TIGR02466 family)